MLNLIQFSQLLHVAGQLFIPKLSTLYLDIALTSIYRRKPRYKTLHKP